jgi:pSer/pThr/pTyr-binding forkhead associated (FHA) protein
MNCREDVGGLRREPLIQLEYLSGPKDGVIARFTQSLVTIGRGEDMDIRIEHDRTASRRHARISREGDSYYLEDLGSTNGTFLNGRRITRKTLLTPGAPFRVGRSWFCVVVEG